MDQDHERHPMTFVSGFLLGAMVGAGITLLGPGGRHEDAKEDPKGRRRVERFRRRSLGRSGRGRQGQGRRRRAGCPQAFSGEAGRLAGC